MVATTLNVCHLSGIMLIPFCVINLQMLLSFLFFSEGHWHFNILLLHPPLIQADLVLNQ